jgi:TolB protein
VKRSVWVCLLSLGGVVGLNHGRLGGQQAAAPAAQARGPVVIPGLVSTLQTIGTVEGSVPTTVYSAVTRFEAPNWTRDGKALIFDQDGGLFRIPVGGGTPVVLDVGAAIKCNGSHGLSPDGKWLAITCAMPDAPETRVYIVPSGGGTPRMLTAHPASYWHSWSPDGKTVVFTRPDHGAINLFAIPFEGGEEQALTTGTGISDDPDFAPDGKWIYFNSNRGGGSMQIWKMRPDGTGAEQVTNDAYANWTPHPSPDGKTMVILSYEPGTAGHPSNKPISLRLVTLGDGKIRTLTQLIGGGGTINVPSWAPDGKRFAFVSYKLP